MTTEQEFSRGYSDSPTETLKAQVEAQIAATFDQRYSFGEIRFVQSLIWHKGLQFDEAYSDETGSVL